MRVGLSYAHVCGEHCKAVPLPQTLCTLSVCGEHICFAKRYKAAEAATRHSLPYPGAYLDRSRRTSNKIGNPLATYCVLKSFKCIRSKKLTKHIDAEETMCNAVRHPKVQSIGRNSSFFEICAVLLISWQTMQRT